MTEHYFTTPHGQENRSEIHVPLQGRTVRVATASGVFSPKALDKGTAVLLDTVPPPQGTQLLDIGCGWGPLTLALGWGAQESAQDGVCVTAIDINERSLALTRDNAVTHGLGAVVETYRPEQVPKDRQFDTIWSNPPIRIGKQALHDLLLYWLARLSPSGTAWLVVQKNLGADSLQKWLAHALVQRTNEPWQVERVATSRGFRVLSVTRKPR